MTELNKKKKDTGVRLNGVHIDESWPKWKQFYTAYYPLLRDMCAVLLICFVLFGMIFNIHTVSGSSMEPTFDSGTIIIGNHIAPDLERGNIVVCKPSNHDKIIIKRIIGVPGDVIDIDYENGIVYRNGVALEEDYVKAPTRADLGLELPITVEDDCYFVMGDNRNNSSDSRTDIVGNIKREDIIGKAWLRIWPLSDFGVLKHQ